MVYGSPPRFQIFVYKEGEVLARSAPPPLKRVFFGGARIAHAGGWVACARVPVPVIARARPHCFGLLQVVFGRARVVSGCFRLFVIVREQERRRMSQKSLKKVVD